MNSALFSATFLQDCNQNSLAHILSFLNVAELGKTAVTSKRLSDTISNEEDYVDLVWQGAEFGMTKINDTYSGKRLESFANAREHCKRFDIASKYAEHCEEVDDLPEDERMGLPQVLTDLFHIKGCDKDRVAAMVEQGKMDETTDEELLSSISLGPGRSWSEISQEEKDKMKQQSQRQNNELKEALKEPVPEKENHHEVFVRVKDTGKNAVVFQGFCPFGQNYVWNIALDSYVTLVGFNRGHTLTVQIAHKSVADTEGIRLFAQSQSPFEQSLDLQFTVVAIDKRDLGVRCLFHGDQTGWTPNCSYHTGATHAHEGALVEKNPSDSVQLGPSGFDRYGLCFSAAIGVYESSDGKEALPPAFLLAIRKDNSIMMEAYMTQALARSFRRNTAQLRQNEEDDEGDSESDSEDDETE